MHEEEKQRRDLTGNLNVTLDALSNSGLNVSVDTSTTPTRHEMATRFMSVLIRLNWCGPQDTKREVPIWEPDDLAGLAVIYTRALENALRNNGRRRR